MYNCCWPDCQAEGTFSAPIHPRDLTKRQYFCAVHIKEFNKRWNGLDGFTEAEIYTLQEPTASWQRPTWGQAAAAATAQKKGGVLGNASDLHGFFNSRLARELNGEMPVSRVQLPKDVKAACSIFGLESPLAEAMLKRRYLNLVKQNHPDVNKAAGAAEAIKRINVAYKILCDYTSRHGVGAS